MKTGILKFYADWCNPCKIVGPIIEEVAQDHGIEVQSVDIDQNQELVDQYKVRGVPTVVLLRDGVPLTVKVGQFSKSQFEDFIQCLK